MLNDFFVIDQPTGGDIGPAPLDRRMEVFLIGKRAVHTFLREIIKRPMSFRSEVRQSLLLSGRELDCHMQSLGGVP